MKHFVLPFLGLALIAFQVRGASQTCSVADECYFDGVATIVPTQSEPNKYVVIGGLFDVHKRGNDAIECSSELSETGLVNLLAFFFGVNKYSNEKNLDPVSVGAVAFDNCMRSEQTVQHVLGYAQCKLHIQRMLHQNLVAYVGPYDDMDVQSSAQLATDVGVTLVSPTANSVDLHVDGTTLLRSSPSFTYDLDAIVAFLRHENVDTEYAIVLYDSTDHFWNAANMELTKKLQSASVCIVLHTDISQHLNDLASFVDGDLKTAVDQRYVIPLMSKENLGKLLGEIRTAFDTRRNEQVYGNLRFIINSEIGSDIVFMSSFADAAKDAIVVSLDDPKDMSADLNEFYNYINGGASAAIPNLDNIWAAEYNTSNILPTFDDKTPSHLKYTASRTLFSVKAIMEGIEGALKDCNPNTYQFCDKYRNEPFHNNLLYNMIVEESGVFDSNGQLKASQVEYSYQRYTNPISGGVQFEDIGNYREGAVQSLNDLNDENSFEKPTCTDPDRCCIATTPPPTAAPTAAQVSTDAPKETSSMEPDYVFVKYERDEYLTGAYPYNNEDRGDWISRFDQNDHTWIIALGVLAGLGILCVVVFEIYILYKMIGTSMARQWRTMLLGQLLLFGIFLSYLVLFVYMFTPTKETCGITRFGVGFCYAICFAVLLVKLMVLLTSKTSDALLPGDESVSYLKGTYQFLMFVFAVGVQVVIDVQWLILVPPDAVKVTSNNGDEVWICNHYTWEASKGWDQMPDFVRTNFENHVLSLVYIMVMILITTILSLNAHGIITNHRESVFIGIASGFSIPIWLAWTLVGGLNYEHDYAQEFGDACIAFGLLATATLILFAMFLPKVRQLVNMGEEGIYVEDDRDTYYAGSVIMAPPSYKKGPPSVIYVNNNQGIYSEPVLVGNGDPRATHLRHPGSTYSAPPAFVKRLDSGHGSTRVLRVTDDLKGRHPQSTKRPQSEVGYAGKPRSQKGTLPRARSHQNLGAL